MHSILKSIEDAITVTEVPVEVSQIQIWIAGGWTVIALLLLLLSLVTIKTSLWRMFLALGICMSILAPLWLVMAFFPRSWPDTAPVVEQMVSHGVIPDGGISSRTLVSGGKIPGSIDRKPTIIELSSVKKSDDSWIIMWKAK